MCCAILIFEPAKSTGMTEIDKTMAESSLNLAKIAMKQIRKCFQEITLISLPVEGTEKDKLYSIALEEGLKREMVEINLTLLNVDRPKDSVCPLTYGIFKAIEGVTEDIVSPETRCKECSLSCPSDGCLALRIDLSDHRQPSLPLTKRNAQASTEETITVMDVEPTQYSYDLQEQNVVERKDYNSGSINPFQPSQSRLKEKRNRICFFCGNMSENHSPPNTVCPVPKLYRCTICLPAVKNHYEGAHTVVADWAKAAMRKKWGADFRFVKNLRPQN